MVHRSYPEYWGGWSTSTSPRSSPRVRLLVETGIDDPIFPAEIARQTVAQLQTVYAALGARDGLYHDVFAGGHQWHGEMAYPFLDRFLRQGQPARTGSECRPKLQAADVVGARRAAEDPPHRP